MSKKGRSKNSYGISRETLTAQILSVLSKNPEQGLNYKQIAKRLNITDPQAKEMISGILAELAVQGGVQEIYPGKYQGEGKQGLYNRYC